MSLEVLWGHKLPKKDPGILPFFFPVCVSALRAPPSCLSEKASTVKLMAETRGGEWEKGVGQGF